MDGDGTGPCRSPARRRGARRADLHLVRTDLPRPGHPDHRARRPPGQGRPVVAGERGPRLPALQLRARPRRARGVAGGVRAAGLARGRRAAGPGAGVAGGGDRRPRRSAPGASLPRCAASPAGPPRGPGPRSVQRVSDVVVGSVAAISVYPVKSLGGRAVPAAQGDAAGLRGDRAHVVVDADTGERVTVKTTPQLAQVVATGDPGADAVTLTEVLGRPVRLARADARAQVDAAAVHLVSQAAIARAAAGDVPAGCSADDPRANLVLD